MVQPGSAGSGQQDADLASFHTDVKMRDGCGRRADHWLAVGKAKGGPVPGARQATVHDLALVQRAGQVGTDVREHGDVLAVTVGDQWLVPEGPGDKGALRQCLKAAD